MKLFLFVVTMVVTININAQNSLQRIVRDKANNEVIPGAIIYFPDLKSGVTSKADGTYQINNLPKIKTLVQVKMLGYGTFIKTIDLSTTTTLDIQLEESAVEANEVVVTGTSHSTELKRSPVPMVSIDQKYLSQTPATNIIDALVKIPGISALSTGPNISKPYIRG